jgi:hypothetical protein
MTVPWVPSDLSPLPALDPREIPQRPPRRTRKEYWPWLVLIAVALVSFMSFGIGAALGTWRNEDPQFCSWWVPLAFAGPGMFGVFVACGEILLLSSLVVVAEATAIHWWLTGTVSVWW